ncbi:MAG: UMP kinase [Thermoplasmatota archaeon]
MERVVIAFGGSVLAPERLEADRLAAVADRVAAWAVGRRLVLVVGGGHVARRYIEAGRALGAQEDALDEVGIAATRLNATLLAAALRQRGLDVAPTRPSVPVTIEEAAAASERHAVVVMGGTVPGHSTDFVGASIAQAVGAARFVIATNVDGVYTADPRKDPEAKRLDHVGHEELLAIVGGGTWAQAGAPGVVDGPASRLLAETGMEAAVVQGQDLDAVGAAATGAPFRGTRIGGA